MGKRAQQQQRPRDALTLYLHEASRERLVALAAALNISKTAVVAQAVSRWVLYASCNHDPRWVWYVEKPLYGAPPRQRGRRASGTLKMYARLPAGVSDQVEALSDTLHVSLSAVVEQALLRWCREDPLVKQSNGQEQVEAQQ